VRACVRVCVLLSLRACFYAKGGRDLSPKNSMNDFWTC